MREYIFRGKQKVGDWVGDWIFGDLIYYSDCKHASISPDEEHCWAVDPDSVGQFTGLYDCTRSEVYPEGRPIYEGDIVKVDGWRKPTLVEWFAANAQFVIDGSLNLGLRNSYMHVIGNVHDNPDLLGAHV